MALIVQKFGGSSVRDIDCLKNVAGLVMNEIRDGNQVVAVVSAMGKTTDNLIAMAKELVDDPPAREMDMLVSTGEQISIAMLAMAIQARGQKAVSFTGPQVGITTCGTHGKARIVQINDAKIRHALSQGNVVIVAGFQGVTGDDEITTLGRGGSDTTAVALGATLGADRCDIYTDVDGVFTTDPRIDPDARRLDVIIYDEMLELASVGAKVLHSRSVEMAKNYDVPLRVLSSFNPGAGTMVVKECENMEDVVVRGVALDCNESKVSILGVPDKPGMAAIVFSRLSEADVNVDMIIQNVAKEGRNNITFTVSKDDFARAMKTVEELGRELGTLGAETDQHIAKLSVVGVGMKSHSGVAAKMFDALAREGISIHMISTSEICISCLIELDQAEVALKAVHREFGLGSG